MIDLNPFAIMPSLPFNEKGETQKKAFAPAWSEIETFDCTVHRSNNRDARSSVRPFTGLDTYNGLESNRVE